MKEDKRSVDEIISSLPKSERIIVQHLRQLVLDAIPFAEEKNSYGVPFYRNNRMICFIWPPSICWDVQQESKPRKSVTLGFCQGNLMSNDEGLLLSEGRKQVYCMYFQQAGQIDDRKISALLFEAGLIDKEFGKKSRKKKV
jgi:hypothetical protein